MRNRSVRQLPRPLIFGAVVSLTLATLFVPSADARAAPGPSPASKSITVGSLEAVPGMQSGLPTGAFGIAVLGTLGNDLYLFGSQSETTGALEGIWRYRSGVWTKLGETRLEFGNGAGADYNRLAPYGAVEYQGTLYIGDRRTGDLYKLVLNADGSFQDVVAVGKVGNEDVFPGPVWRGQLVLGTFGAYSTGEDPAVYTYDGTSVTKRSALTDLGNAGYVTSIAIHNDELWVSGVNSSATLSQVWKFDSNYNSLLMYSGVDDNRLVTSDRQLFAVRTKWAFPYETHSFAKWDGTRFLQTSAEFGPFPMIGSLGAINVQGTLLDLSYYNGVYAFRDGVVEQVIPGMPAMGAPMSVKVFQGYLWIASNQPVGLYRVKLLR